MEYAHVPTVIFIAQLKYGVALKDFQQSHAKYAQERAVCCDESKTQLFLDAEDTGQVVIMLQHVEYNAFKRYLSEVGFGRWAQKTEAYKVYRRLPAGLPPGCMGRCLSCLVPIHGHFLALWTLEAEGDFERWCQHFKSPEQEELRKGLEVPVKLFKGLSEPTKVLGFAPDVNWKAAMRYLTSSQLYQSIPAARRAGELDIHMFDGARTQRERDVLAHLTAHS